MSTCTSRIVISALAACVGMILGAVLGVIVGIYAAVGDRRARR